MRDELKEKIAVAIERLKTFESPEGYHLAFSGGKDSCVIKALADMAVVKYHAVYRVTGIDPPELVRFIKKHHPDVEFEYPRYPDGRRVTMWNLIPKKLMPPTRIARYCCEFMKESSGDGKMTITGVRWAESKNRKENQGLVTVMASGKKIVNKLGLQNDSNFTLTKRGVILVNDNDESRRMIEQCYKRHKTSLNPIIDWTDEDVWEFINEFKIQYCVLYDEGFTRIGCIGCPMARKHGREIEFSRYPKYKRLYIKAFDEMLKERKRLGKDRTSWRSGMDVFNWWMEYDILPGQCDLFEEMEDE